MTTTTPSHAAQMVAYPLVVKAGMHGYYLAYVGGSHVEHILHQNDPDGLPPWFPTMEAAEYARVVALMAVAA